MTCFFRGREMAYPEQGIRVVKRMFEGVQDIAQMESPLKRMGRNMIVILAPLLPKGKKGS